MKIIKTKVYLAGSCRNVPVEQRNSWRNYIEEMLVNYTDLSVFNPNRHFSYEKNNVNNEKLVMDYFTLFNLKNTDVVVLNLNDSAVSVGTGIEIGYALALNKFIIGFGSNNVYEYLRDKCSVVFDDVDKIVDFLIEHFND